MLYVNSVTDHVIQVKIR